MNVNEVSNEDGRACAQLLKFLSHGKWELSGDDAEILSKTKQWVHGLAIKMANDIKSKSNPAPVPPPVSESTGFKIKGMGPLAGSNTKKLKNKSK